MTEAVVRLDERLARSPVGEGFVERTHFHDAAAALWLEGELVHIDDLVLHDALMDIRAPTHELTRAHAVLRTRRKILTNDPDWALGREGLQQLTGRAAQPGKTEPPAARGEGGAVDIETAAAEDDRFAGELAEIDAVLAHSQKLLDAMQPVAETSPDLRPALVYDLDWDEEARLAEWQAALMPARDLPPVMRAVLLLDAWTEIEVLQHAAWIGPLLAAALLRQEGSAANHLMCLHVGLRSIPRERRRAQDRNERLLAVFDAIHEAALAGLKEHDRLVLARGQMERRLRSRRSSSKLPELVELVLSRPLVSTALIQKTLKVSRQGALNLVGELSLREMTGRGRFRAWGIL